MSLAILHPSKQPDQTDGGCLRLAAIGVRRYASEPDGRRNAARLLLSAALGLYIRHAGRAEAARACLNILGDRGAR